MRQLFAAIAFGVFPLIIADAAVMPRAGLQQGQSVNTVPGVIIVKLLPTGAPSKSGVLTSDRRTTILQHGVLSLEQIFPVVAGLSRANPMAVQGLDRIYYATIDPSRDVNEAAAALARMPGVEYAEPKYLQTLYDTPNDPSFTSSQAGYFALMHVADAWTTVKTNGAVIIADVDGGTYWQHEDLSPNLWINAAEDINHNGKYDPSSSSSGGDLDGVDQDGDGYVDDVIGWNFATGSGNPAGLASTPESAAHGTATASMVAAATDNGIGMAGTAWNCKLMPINAASKTLDNSIAYGYEGIQFAAAHGARVINCSWGRTGSFSKFEHDIVAAASASGALVVAAAANGGLDNDVVPNYPSSYKEVLGVGATNNANTTVASFTNYGISVPVYAPGVSILGALNGGGYAIVGSGTSFTSPLTAGLAALLFTQHPGWTPAQVAAQIRVSGDPIDDANPTLSGNLGHGMVNFLRAVTESHPGLEEISDTVVVSSGRAFIVPGDTLHVSVSLKNVLPQSADNVQFTLMSEDPSLRVISGTASVGSIPQDASVTLPDFVVHADSINTSHTVVLALRWVSNGVDADAIAIPVTVFSSAPAWQLYDTPSMASLFSVKAVDDAVIWAAGGDGAKSAPTVVRSIDGGATWRDATGSLSGIDIYCVTATDSLHAWIGSGDGHIFATTNGGTSWSEQTYPGTQSPFIDGIWFFDGQNGIALGDPPGGSSDQYIILATSNGGQAWNHIASEPVGGTAEAGWNNSWWWTDPQHGWFGTNAMKVWRTTDGGAHWLSGASTAKNSIGVSFADSLHGVAAHDDGTISITTDGGVSWTDNASFSGGLTAVSFVPGSSSVWAVGPFNPFHSVDTGKSWVEETTYPFLGGITHVSAVAPTHAWASTSFGQILSYIPITTSVPGPVPIGRPAEFALLQNYPNPFNPSTTIQYTVGGVRDQGSGVSEVKLVIYDVLGREVATLVNTKQAPGSYEVKFDGSRFASGVYFYRLTAGTSAATRKMLLLK